MSKNKHYPLYLHSIELAKLLGQENIYIKSLAENINCAADVEKSLGNTQLEAGNLNEMGKLINKYNKLINKYGYDRLFAVLAHTLNKNKTANRYSSDNINWAKIRLLPKDTTLADFAIKSNPIQVNKFIDTFREFYNSEQDNLPQTDFEKIANYEVKDFIIFDNNKGFAIAENQLAVQPFLTSMITLEDEKKDYDWGHYSSDSESCVDDFENRITFFLQDFNIDTKYSHIVSAEKSLEQNQNMLDGIINNINPDDEIKEKPSVIKKIYETKKAEGNINIKKEQKNKDNLER